MFSARQFNQLKIDGQYDLVSMLMLDIYQRINLWFISSHGIALYCIVGPHFSALQGYKMSL